MNALAIWEESLEFLKKLKFKKFKRISRFKISDRFLLSIILFILSLNLMTIQQIFTIIQDLFCFKV